MIKHTEPRSAVTWCGDPTVRLSSLWWQGSSDIQATRLWQPNRRAGGRASCGTHAFGMTMRGGLRP